MAYTDDDAYRNISSVFRPERVVATPRRTANQKINHVGERVTPTVGVRLGYEARHQEYANSNTTLL